MVSPPFPSKTPNLDDVMDAIIQAGEKIQEIYDTDFEVNKKDDNSPITKADLESIKFLEPFWRRLESQSYQKRMWMINLGLPVKRSG